MSVELMSLVWKTDLKLAPKMILLALADSTNAEDGYCWPNLTTLSKKCSISRRPLIKHIKDLCEQGFLEKTKDFHSNGRQRSNYYVLKIDKLKLRIPDSNSKKNKQFERRGVLQEHGGGAPQTPSGVLLEHPSKENRKKEPELENNKARMRAFSHADARDLFEKLWSVYSQHCNRDKKKAFEKFLKLKPDKNFTEKLIAAINDQNSYNQDLSLQKKFVPAWPYLVRWLNNERWLDEVKHKNVNSITHMGAY